MAAAQPALTGAGRRPAPGQALNRWGLALLPVIIIFAARPLLPAWLNTPAEALILPFVDWINAIFKFLKTKDIFVWFSLRDLTRFIALAVEWLIDMVEGILVSGFDRSGLPALPWIMTAGLFAVFGCWLKGWRLGLLAGGCIFYLALFGKWKLAMTTLAMVLVCAPVSALGGLLLGILALKYKFFERLLWPCLNVMQSLPHFSYLIPIAVFIGVSHRAGAIATIVFAVPPMARLTLLGLGRVADEVLEAGITAGCTARQMLWKVRIPAARASLMAGVNQVIMQCLAMVVIASFVGAKGLGHDLLFRLQSLRLGQALETGVAIVFIAIMLDRLSLAFSEKKPDHVPAGPFWRTHPWLMAAGAVVIAAAIAAAAMPALHTLPKALTITTAPLWDALIDIITLHFYEPLQGFRDFALIHVLIPIRDGFGYTPWIAIAWLVTYLGWRLAGWRLGLIVLAYVLFIVCSGFYERALITAYMVFVALLIATVIGVPLAVWASASDGRAGNARLLCDIFQTFPSFVYLIPVIMLFRVGDVAAIMAVIIYSMIPIVRYTLLGLRAVPGEIIEAAITSGATPMQILLKARMPLALPEIMLGINQALMFALFMVIIAAFIGTVDLGQEIFRALTFNDAGRGLVVGLCVAFMGLTADKLIVEWARQKKQALGIKA